MQPLGPFPPPTGHDRRVAPDIETLGRETREAAAREKRMLHRITLGLAGVGGTVFALACWAWRVDEQTQKVDGAMTLGALVIGACALLCFLGAFGIMNPGTPESTAALMKKTDFKVPHGDFEGREPEAPPNDRWTD